MKKYSFEVDSYFKLDKILYGQCFRWKQNDDGSFVGVIKDNVIKIWQEKNMVYYYAMNEKNIQNIVIDYFDLNTSYKKIISDFKKKDNSVLNEIIKYSKGTRILHQDRFEILVSYIISASNNISRIQGSIEKLSKLYGTKVIFNKKEYYLFPTIEQLRNVQEKDYENKIHVGYRAKYLRNTVKLLLKADNLLEKISNMNIDDVRKELVKLEGVGPKVADCVMLFSMNKKEVFPVDRWIQRVMEKYTQEKHLTKLMIHNISEKEFGEYAGVMNHYMFYWGRENKISN